MKKKFITLRYNEHKKIFYRYQKLGAEKKSQSWNMMNLKDWFASQKIGAENEKKNIHNPKI